MSRVPARGLPWVHKRMCTLGERKTGNDERTRDMTYAAPTVDESDLFGQVRTFTVHDDYHGGYVPVVIGYWDRRGNTHCLDCMPEPGEQDDRGYPFGITCDNSAAEGDRCDTCGVSILAAALDRRAQRQPFPSTCEKAYAPALVSA